MADSIQFDLVSPERAMLSATASMVAAPGVDGEFGAMPGHAPFFTTLRPGVVTAEVSGGPKRFVVFGGFAEVGPDRCTILADTALPLEELKAGTVDEKIADAEEALAKADNESTARRAQYLNDLRALKMMAAA